MGLVQRALPLQQSSHLADALRVSCFPHLFEGEARMGMSAQHRHLSAAPRIASARECPFVEQNTIGPQVKCRHRHRLSFREVAAQDDSREVTLKLGIIRTSTDVLSAFHYTKQNYRYRFAFIVCKQAFFVLLARRTDARNKVYSTAGRRCCFKSTACRPCWQPLTVVTTVHGPIPACPRVFQQTLFWQIYLLRRRCAPTR